MSDDLLKRMNNARDFPANTCGASRHAAMIAEALCKLEDYPMLAEEPKHCGGSIAATVAMLWECRAKLTKAVEALDEAIYLLDPDDEDIAKETGLHRIVTTLAELKEEDQG